MNFYNVVYFYVLSQTDPSKIPIISKNILQTQLSHEKTVAYFPSDTVPVVQKGIIIMVCYHPHITGQVSSTIYSLNSHVFFFPKAAAKGSFKKNAVIKHCYQTLPNFLLK